MGKWVPSCRHVAQAPAHPWASSAYANCQYTPARPPCEIESICRYAGPARWSGVRRPDKPEGGRALPSAPRPRSRQATAPVAAVTCGRGKLPLR